MEEIAGRIKQGYKWERNDVSPSLEFFSIQRLSDHPESAQLSVAVDSLNFLPPGTEPTAPPGCFSLYLRRGRMWCWEAPAPIPGVGPGSCKKLDPC